MSYRFHLSQMSKTSLCCVLCVHCHKRHLHDITPVFCNTFSGGRYWNIIIQTSLQLTPCRSRHRCSQIHRGPNSSWSVCHNEINLHGFCEIYISIYVIKLENICCVGEYNNRSPPSLQNRVLKCGTIESPIDYHKSNTKIHYSLRYSRYLSLERVEICLSFWIIFVN